MLDKKEHYVPIAVSHLFVPNPDMVALSLSTMYRQFTG